MFLTCAGLQKFAESVAIPALEPHLQKLAQSRAKVSRINSTLVTINNRLDRMQSIIHPQAKVSFRSLVAASETEPQQQPQQSQQQQPAQEQSQEQVPEQAQPLQEQAEDAAERKIVQ